MPHTRTTAQPELAPLRRRLAVGLFLDIWPVWAAVALVLAGTIAVVCRLSVAAAAPMLPWLWLAPVLVILPVLFTCIRRAYTPAEIAALADVLAGGHGVLLTLTEREGAAWSTSALAERAGRFAMPRLRLGPAMTMVGPSGLFLLVALLLPQRVPESSTSGVLAQEVAANLTAALVELKKQELVTPEEEERLEEEIERIQRSAEKRVDASSWEAADALREKIAAGLSEKQDAVKWAEQSLARYTAAMQAGGPADPTSAASATELSSALDKLAATGMLAGASPELKAALGGGKTPIDAATLAKLSAALAEQLAEAKERLAGLGQAGQAFGRFNPEEFAISKEPGPDGDGAPGRGGLNRGRADAALTWGQETDRADKFKSKPLPPGAPRSPDDWAPVVVLPGAPEEAAALSVQTAARQYAAAAGQGAWRRSLAPRHQSAVKKYFETTKPKYAAGGF
jgi:hypothetical protein